MPHVRARVALSSIAVFLSAVSGPAFSQPGPLLPCHGQSPAPAYASAGQTPSFQTWTGGDPGSPLSCAGWTSLAKPKVTVALAGRFPFDGNASQLFAKLGALSAWPAIRYWSASTGAWQALALEASALRSADPAQRRGDFSAADLAKGSVLHYVQKDAHAGEVVYRLTVHEASETRLVMSSENVAAIRRFGLPVFAAGSLQTLQVMERLSATEWGFYQIVFARPGLSRFVPAQTSSYVNRLAAMFRHVAGLRTDQEPPVSP